MVGRVGNPGVAQLEDVFSGSDELRRVHGFAVLQEGEIGEIPVIQLDAVEADLRSLEFEGGAEKIIRRIHGRGDEIQPAFGGRTGGRRGGHQRETDQSDGAFSDHDGLPGVDEIFFW